MNHDNLFDPRLERKVPISSRKSKVNSKDFPSVPEDFGWYPSLEKMIPNILRGDDLRQLISRIERARRRGAPFVLMLGAHVIKCGLGPLIRVLIEKGFVTGVAMNGACAIHDAEIALWGVTSEDVGVGLREGTFGMCKETASLFNRAARRCLDRNIGLGEAVVSLLEEEDIRYPDLSILHTCGQSNVPLTIHVAIGTDVVHQHTDAEGKGVGHGTMLDFRKFTQMIANIDGGVILNIGSAVIMPEVFLKAVAVCRNRGIDLSGFTAANFDMIVHYRPTMNIVERPRLLGARTYQFTGNHELLIPMLVAGLIYRLGS